MLYLSGIWGPLLRSTYTKENQGLKFQLILGLVKNVLAVVFCTTKLKKGFWAALKAWEQTSKASPSPNLVKSPNLTTFKIK